MIEKFGIPQSEIWNILRYHIFEASRNNAGPYPFIIGIGGAGCMGKSYFATELVSYAPTDEAVLFDIDGYLINPTERDNNQLTGYNPKSYDFVKAEKDYFSILSSESTSIKGYNHFTRTYYDIDIPKCSKINTIIVEGVHANSVFFRPSRLNTLKIEFVPESDETLNQSRLEVEMYSRGRYKDYKNTDWPVRLRKHKNDYHKFIEKPRYENDIKIIVSRVNMYERPTISEIHYLSNNSLIIRKPNQYTTEQIFIEEEHKLIYNLLQIKKLLEISDIDVLNNSEKKELITDIDRVNKDKTDISTRKNILTKFNNILSKENIERGTLLIKIIEVIAKLLPI